MRVINLCTAENKVGVIVKMHRKLGDELCITSWHLYYYKKRRYI